jgi:hypothetical protein
VLFVCLVLLFGRSTLGGGEDESVGGVCLASPSPSARVVVVVDHKGFRLGAKRGPLSYGAFGQGPLRRCSLFEEGGKRACDVSRVSKRCCSSSSFFFESVVVCQANYLTPRQAPLVATEPGDGAARQARDHERGDQRYPQGPFAPPGVHVSIFLGGDSSFLLWFGVAAAPLESWLVKDREREQTRRGKGAFCVSKEKKWELAEGVLVQQEAKFVSRRRANGKGVCRFARGSR